MELSYPEKSEKPWHEPDERLIETSECYVLQHIRKKWAERHRSSDQLPVSLRLEDSRMANKSVSFRISFLSAFSLSSVLAGISAAIFHFSKLHQS
jgi:hypothetical protein